MSNKVGVEHQPVNFWVVVSNIVDFPSLLGEVILFDEHILQMGWFNHQLVLERNPEKRKKLYQEAIIYNKPCGCPLRLPWQHTFWKETPETKNKLYQRGYNKLGFVFVGDFFTDSIPWDSSPFFTTIWENVFGSLVPSASETSRKSKLPLFFRWVGGSTTNQWRIYNTEEMFGLYWRATSPRSPKRLGWWTVWSTNRFYI